jgi:hypothetical protein
MSEMCLFFIRFFPLLTRTLRDGCKKRRADKQTAHKIISETIEWMREKEKEKKEEEKFKPRISLNVKWEEEAAAAAEGQKETGESSCKCVRGWYASVCECVRESCLRYVQAKLTELSSRCGSLPFDANILVGFHPATNETKRQRKSNGCTSSKTYFPITWYCYPKALPFPYPYMTNDFHPLPLSFPLSCSSNLLSLRVLEIFLA